MSLLRIIRDVGSWIEKMEWNAFERLKELS